MGGEDPKSPMQGPRTTDEVMASTARRPADRDRHQPEDAATDEATQAVEIGQEDA
jgi:hypothetical protein